MVFGGGRGGCIKTSTWVSITFLVSGWFCEIDSCGKKGAVREFTKKCPMSKKEENIQKRFTRYSSCFVELELK